MLLETLNILEGFPMREMRQGSAPSLHVMVEAMKRAYADRARYLGDPAFVNAPVATPDLEGLRRQATRQDRSQPATPWTGSAPATAAARRQATPRISRGRQRRQCGRNTYTLNFSYGVGLVAEGTGVLLNNELDDFTAKPGAPNAYGLVGVDANAPGPGKRPLSSMTPTIVLKDGKPFLVTGSPGGSRIITAVLQVLGEIEVGVALRCGDRHRRGGRLQGSLLFLAASATGRSKVKVLPWPGSLSALIVPPCASTTERAIARPMPVPPSPRARALSTR